MKPFFIPFFCAVFLFCWKGAGYSQVLSAGNALDTLIFAQEASEKAHELVASESAVFQGEMAVSGAGAGCWDKADSFFFRHRELKGDGFVQAKISSTGSAHNWVKVGVMMRAELSPASANVFMFDTWGQGLASQVRAQSGSGTSQKIYKTEATGPFWVRVERQGDQFTASVSNDGKNWETVSVQKSEMPASIQAGFAMTSNDDLAYNHATIDQLDSTGSGGWTDSTIGGSPLIAQVQINGMSESARRLLPKNPPDYYGGDLVFRMKVDPQAQNYCTVKLWGSEGGGSLGRIVLVCEGKEIGQRHGAGADIFVDNVGSVSPGAFWYRTSILPKWLTEGKTSVEIRLRSTGSFYAYGRPWNYDMYQHKLKRPSRGLYRFYTHTNPVLIPDPAEKQGKALSYGEAPVRPFNDALETAALQKHKDEINKRITDLLKKDQFNRKEVEFLGHCTEVEWSAAYGKPEVIAHLVKVIDNDCRKFNQDPKTAAGEWGGGYGNQGAAVAVIAPKIRRELDESVDLGGGLKPRREQWSAMLAASRDAGRFSRKTITNQMIFCDLNIYRANMGLLALNSPEAFPEPQARRYLREAAGLEPYTYSDPKPGEKSKPPYEVPVFAVTAKGTTHEWNWCCQNCYGRMGPEVYEMFLLSGDKDFLRKAVEIERAHVMMLYASVDKGGFRAMLNEGVICTRNVYHPGQISYGDSQVAAASADPFLLAGIRQQLADGQIFNTWRHSPLTMYWPDDYLKLKRLVSSVKGSVPATPGQPDFAWADEQNALVAIKKGDELHFITFARRSEQGYHGMGDAHSLTPHYERVAQFMVEDLRYTATGKFTTIGPEVQSPFTGTPPDKPTSAWEGQKWPQAVGRPGTPADFYGTRFGDFVIGMNSSLDKPAIYEPEGFSGGVDMISGKTHGSPVQVPPQSTVVFHQPRSK